MLCGLLRNRRGGRRLLNGLIVISIAFILLAHIIPQSIQHGGNAAFGMLALGLVFPIVLERLMSRAHYAAHTAIVVLAAAGLMLHAVIDGLALRPEHGHALAIAIILHRLPVGMAVWWVVRPNLGKWAAVTTIAAIAIATAAGYLLADAVAALAETRPTAWLQAFVAGSLVHVVLFGVKHHD